MAKTPITNFSHNSLDPYTGTSQKFIDARQAGALGEVKEWYAENKESFDAILQNHTSNVVL